MDFTLSLLVGQWYTQGILWQGERDYWSEARNSWAKTGTETGQWSRSSTLQWSSEGMESFFYTTVRFKGLWLYMLFLVVARSFSSLINLNFRIFCFLLNFLYFKVVLVRIIEEERCYFCAMKIGLITSWLHASLKRLWCYFCCVKSAENLLYLR